MNGGTRSARLTLAGLVPLAVLLLGAETAPAPEPPPIEWTAGCEDKAPCRVLIEGKQALVTGRGRLRCAARGETLGCIFSSKNGRSHAAWFIGLRDHSVHPIRVDSGQSLLAEPVWDPDGLRIMLRRSDGSLTTRTVVAPKVQPPVSGQQGWSAGVGDPDEEPRPVRLALGPDDLLWTSAGPRFRVADGSAAGPAPFGETIREGVSLEALEILPEGDALLAGSLRAGAKGFEGAAVVKVVGGALGGRDLFLARLEESGKLKWLRTWGSAGDDSLVALALVEGKEVVRVEAHYGGLVDLDPGEGTRLANPADELPLMSRFDLAGLILPESVPEQVPPECQTGDGPSGQVPPECQTPPIECRLRLGKGPVPRAPRAADLRLNSDQASTWVGCFEGESALWMLVVPAGVMLEDAVRKNGRLCLGGQARGGPHDLAVKSTQNLYVGDPEVESVAFVACLELEQTLAPALR